MSDLIERLRDDRHIYYNRPLNFDEMRIWHLLCCEAADEIERLNDKLLHSDRKEIEACYRKMAEQDARIEELERLTSLKGIEVVIEAGIEAVEIVVSNRDSGDLKRSMNALEDWATQAADHLKESYGIQNKTQDQKI